MCFEAYLVRALETSTVTSSDSIRETSQGPTAAVRPHHDAAPLGHQEGGFGKPATNSPGAVAPALSGLPVAAAEVLLQFDSHDGARSRASSAARL